jgi:hypothetical protein
MIHFTYTDRPLLPEGKLVYVPGDYAFQTIPPPPVWNSVTVNTFEIFLDAQGFVTGGGGYCPCPGWKKKCLTLPVATPGNMRCHGFQDFTTRIPRSLDSAAWEVCCDNAQGWICIESLEKTSKQCTYIEVLEDFVLGLENAFLNSIWIKLRGHDA